jgi:hypothetical protein
MFCLCNEVVLFHLTPSLPKAPGFAPENSSVLPLPRQVCRPHQVACVEITMEIHFQFAASPYLLSLEEWFSDRQLPSPLRTC